MTRFRCVPFAELTLAELYASMVLRQEVFVVEQHCPYQDADGRDQAAWHVMGRDSTDALVAYARILAPGVAYAGHPSIGRVVTSAAARRTGAGRELMAEALGHTVRLFPGQSIKISAQSYLRRFYESFGFEVVGDEYLEDDIPHLPMLNPMLSGRTGPLP
jgi:ElaA protein